VTPRRIVLVGFMGTGKSIVGRAIAERLNWTFRDMDAWIEQRSGCTIAQMFRDKGEPYFREQELRVAQEVGKLEDHVIAAGGGAFAQPQTREALRDGAATVWLRCDIDVVLRRIAGDASRPLASDRERMQALLAEREPSYRMADLMVDTTDQPPNEVAEQIVSAFFPGREPRGGTER
jgi:shikimate kinase/3-dehydroquinate synthase